MILGSCLCGQVRFELAGTPQFINHCHCAMCRKVHGAAFGSFLHADAAGFRWLAGQALVEGYRSSPGNVRAFCRVCGSNLPVLEEDDAHVVIPAGSLDADPGVRPVVHIHTASKAPWSRSATACRSSPSFHRTSSGQSSRRPRKDAR